MADYFELMEKSSLEQWTGKKWVEEELLELLEAFEKSWEELWNLSKQVEQALENEKDNQEKIEELQKLVNELKSKMNK